MLEIKKMLNTIKNNNNTIIKLTKQLNTIDNNKLINLDNYNNNIIFKLTNIINKLNNKNKKDFIQLMINNTLKLISDTTDSSDTKDLLIKWIKDIKNDLNKCKNNLNLFPLQIHVYTYLKYNLI